jgi:hypothetical protein
MNRTTFACGRYSGIHAGRSRTDNKHITLKPNHGTSVGFELVWMNSESISQMSPQVAQKINTFAP